MLTYDQIYNTLVTKGYYAGTFDDFWQDENHDGVTKDKFEEAVDIFRQSAENMDEYYKYRHNYTEQNLQYYVHRPGYTGPKPTEEDASDFIPYSRRNIRKKFIEDVNAGGGNIRTTQQWALVGGSIVKGNVMSETFRTLTKSFVSKVYKSLAPYKDTLFIGEQYSVYKQDDFSEIHYDGVRKTRTCVIIYYFADPSTYKDSGGRLIIAKDENTSRSLCDKPKMLDHYMKNESDRLEFVTPVYGNYAMLDFSHHDLGHAIEVVKDDFTRFALQSFVGIDEK